MSMPMKRCFSLVPVARISLCSAMVFGLTVANAPAAAKTVLARTLPAKKDPADSPASASLIPEVPATPIPESVFEVPASPKEGRNPFFPQSVAEKPAVKSATQSWDPSVLVLNGITSPPKPTAMINSRTFEAGESGEVKLRDGSRLPVKCIEIRKDSVLIEVRGQQRELKLRSGL